MNKKTDKGIILFRTDFGERDRILTVLLKENGKARLVAKGVRSSKSKMAGGIELFSESQLGFIQGRGEMFTLTSSRLVQHFGHIVEDYDKTQLAYGILKVVDKIAEDGQGQEYYSLLLAALGYLDSESLECEAVSIWFNLHLLEVTGHGVNLRGDRDNKPLPETAKYSFDPEKNCFYPDSSGMFAKHTVKLLRYVHGSDKPVQSDIPAAQHAKAAKLLSDIVARTVV